MSKVVMQLALAEERETQILVDYPTREVRIYTNVATVMNRLSRMKINWEHEQYLDGQVFSRCYRLPLKDIGKLAKKGIFYCGTDSNQI